MIISIIGAGALGKAYGGLLSLAHEVHFLMRSDYSAISENKGFHCHFEQFEKNILVKDPHIHHKADTLPLSDVVIISLKTTENKAIPSLLSHCLKPSTVMLIIQNGIGNEEWVAQFTQCDIVCGISSMGAFRASPLQVEIPILGELRLAPFRGEKACEQIKVLFKESPIKLEPLIFPSYKEIRWRKLLWNVPFSTLSIIYKQDTNTLASMQPFASIVLSVMREVAEIAKTQGVMITEVDMMKMMELTKTFKNYYPSMYRDYFKGLPIEKEYIIDNVISIARANEVQTPMLNMIGAHLEDLGSLSNIVCKCIDWGTK